jgi:hypothetical protein
MIVTQENGMNRSAAYKQELAEVVSQAVVHLHNALGPVGTALLDEGGDIVFSNNASNYTNDDILTQLAARAHTEPGAVLRHNLEHATAFTALLDHEHIFVVLGHGLEDGAVSGFVASLRQVLPESATDD